MSQPLQLGLLKNSQDRGANTKFFDQHNHEISFCVEYQSGSSLNILLAVKGWENSEYRTGSYEFSCNKQYFCPSCFYAHYNSSFPHLLLCTRALYTTLLMKEFADSRWWGRHTVLLVVLGMLATDRSSRHHRHPTLWNTWPPKLSYCANSSKGSSNSSSGVGTMSTNLRLPTTQTSWVLSLRCSTK